MYSIFKELLEAYGISVAEVCKATGISQSTLSNWKKRNNMLSAKTARKLADFFHVSVDYLMGNEETYYGNFETAEKAQELFENQGMRILFDAAKDARPEDLQMAADLLRRLKETNPDG